jgi:hypothetical protein
LKSCPEILFSRTVALKDYCKDTKTNKLSQRFKQEHPLNLRATALTYKGNVVADTPAAINLTAEKCVQTNDYFRTRTDNSSLAWRKLSGPYRFWGSEVWRLDETPRLGYFVQLRRWCASFERREQLKCHLPSIFISVFHLVVHPT